MRAFVFASVLCLGAACGSPQIVVSSPLAVVNFAPHDGASNVDPSASQGVCFNLSIKLKDATEKKQVTLLDDADVEAPGLELQAAAGEPSDPMCVEIQHARLRDDTPYRIRLVKGLAAATNQVLATDVTSRFRTARP